MWVTRPACISRARRSISARGALGLCYRRLAGSVLLRRRGGLPVRSATMRTCAQHSSGHFLSDQLCADRFVRTILRNDQSAIPRFQMARVRLVVTGGPRHGGSGGIAEASPPMGTAVCEIWCRTPLVSCSAASLSWRGMDYGRSHAQFGMGRHELRVQVAGLPEAGLKLEI